MRAAPLDLANAHIFAVLLEEKGHARRDALLPNRPYPIGMHGPRFWPTLPAYNHPMDSGKVHSPQVLKQRLQAQEAHCGGRLAKVVDAREGFEGDAQPDVTGGALRVRLVVAAPIRPADELWQPLCALSEQLEPMLLACAHGQPQLIDGREIQRFMQPIAQRIHEVRRRPPVAERNVKALLDQPHFPRPVRPIAVYHRETGIRRLYLRIRIACQAVNLGDCVALLTAGGDLRATEYWIPRSVSPTDAAFLAHLIAPLGYRPPLRPGYQAGAENRPRPALLPPWPRGIALQAQSGLGQVDGAPYHVGHPYPFPSLRPAEESPCGRSPKPHRASPIYPRPTIRRAMRFRRASARAF